MAFESLASLSSVRPVAVACGFFDGVHLGHQAVIGAMVEYCQKHQCQPVVLTFEPHPRKWLSSGDGPLLITSYSHRNEILRRLYGEELIIVSLAFDEEVAGMSPETFLYKELLSGPVLKAFFCGEDWRFGSGGSGDVALLSQFGAQQGFDVFPVAQLNDSNGKISSSRIRQFIRVGQLDQVERLLGRRFTISGEVCTGDQIASKILSCPTANVKTTSEIFPLNGVYAGFARLQDGRCMPGVINIGHSPTFHGSDNLDYYKLEFHIFEFNEVIYGQAIEIEFVSFIREERHYAQIDELLKEIEQDLATARALLVSQTSELI